MWAYSIGPVLTFAMFGVYVKLRDARLRQQGEEREQREKERRERKR
jgi:hypothetical protein